MFLISRLQQDLTQNIQSLIKWLQEAIQPQKLKRIIITQKKKKFKILAETVTDRKKTSYEKTDVKWKEKKKCINTVMLIND